MSEDWLVPQPTTRLRSDVCCDELVPLAGVFPDAPLVIKHPVHSSLDVGLVHECSERNDDVVETKKIWAIDFRWHFAFDDAIIVRPSQYAFNSVQDFSLRESNESPNSGVSLRLRPDDRTVLPKQPDRCLHFEVWRLRFPVTDSLPFVRKPLPLFRAGNKARENKNIPAIFTFPAAAVIDETPQRHLTSLNSRRVAET